MKVTIIILAIITTILNDCHSQWQTTGGPMTNIDITDIFSYDSVDYISVKGCGLFSKASNEQDWNHISNQWFDNHTLKNDSLFVTAKRFSGGVTIDDGTLYIDLSAGIEISKQLMDFSIPIISHSDFHLYTKTSKSLFRMDFDGSNLKDISEGLPMTELNGPEIDLLSFELYDDRMFCGTNFGLYTSAIHNPEWTLSIQAFGMSSICSIEEHEGTLYCALYSELYKSDDVGHSWDLILNLPSGFNSMHFDRDTIYVVTQSDGLAVSTNLGETWSSYFQDIIENPVIDITQLGKDLTFITEAGLYNIQDEIWLSQNSGLSCSYIRDLNFIESELLSLDWQQVNIFSNSKWSNISPKSQMEGFSNLAVLNDTIFVSLAKPTINGNSFIWYSIDNGMNWGKLDNQPPLEGDDSYRLLAHQGRLYAHEDDFLFYTEDLGKHWNQISWPDEYCNGIDQLVVVNSQLYAKTCDTGILKLDNDNQWVDIGRNLPDESVENLIFTNEHVIANVTGNGIYRSLIGLDSWELLLPSSEDIRELSIRIQDYLYQDSILYLATNKGVFISTDQGASFVEYNDGLVNLNTTTLASKNDTLYVGTAGIGVWKRYIDKDDLPPITNGNIISEDFEIYPNPSFDFINILSKENHQFRIVILDLEGRELLNQEYDGMPINIQKLSPGTYIVQIFSNNLYSSHKFVIIH